MRIAVITAGGAGMFCGSCMQDNTLVRTLRLAGEEAVLVPTYTPIRVDEEDTSLDRVFLGGVNVYLDSAIPGWRRLPGWAISWLNKTRVLRLLTRLGSSTDAAHLGALTLDMLQGVLGPQQREIVAFGDYLCHELQPDVIVFSNALLSGVLSDLRPRFDGPILCLLQGDDIFLDALSPRWRQPVIDQMSANCASFDGFLTHSSYYRDFMVDYLRLPASKFQQIPLTIDTAGIPEPMRPQTAARFNIGYFARLCPEKGIQNLLAAAPAVLAARPNAQIVIGGYLPRQYAGWFYRQFRRLERRFPGRVCYSGSPTERIDKYRIISTFDVLCVPTDYREPKGLYVLEAGLLGIPSVLPEHGAFPELVDQLQSGTLYDPRDPDALAAALIRHPDAATGDSVERLPDRVRASYGMEATAPALASVLRQFASASPPGSGDVGRH